MSSNKSFKKDHNAENVIKVVKEILDGKIDNVSDYLIFDTMKHLWINNFGELQFLNFTKTKVLKNDKSNSQDKNEYICITMHNYAKLVSQELIVQRISMRRRQVLLHSCIYYKFNSNVISDDEYDNFCFDLKKLQIDFPKLSEKAVLHSVFKDWHLQGTTSGYDLPYENPKVIERAKRVMKLNKWYKK